MKTSERKNEYMGTPKANEEEKMFLNSSATSML